MKILSECNLSQVVVDLLSGQTAIFPTETSYGLGCDATNQKSVDEIFKIKGRSDDKPLLIVVPSIAEAKKYMEWNEQIDTMAQKYWPPFAKAAGGKPGALTVVGEAKGNLAKGVIAKDGTVAIRVTAHPLLKSITEKLGVPLVATSANLAGEPSIYDGNTIAAVFKDSQQQPDFVLNYGVLPPNPPSTLVSALGGVIKILRQGSVVVAL